MYKFKIDFFGTTPKKAKQVRNYAMAIVAVAGALWIANSAGQIELAESFLQSCKIITIAGGALGFTSQSVGNK